jgi:DNA-directed RNA polymerase
MQQRHMVRTVLQSAAILKAPDQCPVARSKQRSAFPPNYIHSLDSSHMMMTAIECSGAGASPPLALLVFAG